jgi:WD40 repeat protein
VWWTAASPDGKLLAVQTGPLDGADSGVEVVQLATGKVLQNHTLRYGPSGVEFSPDGSELVSLACCWTGSGSTLVAWDAHTGRQLFSSGSFDAESFDLSPDSRLVGVGTGDGRFVRLDARTGKPTTSIQVGAGEISNLSFSPDGRSVAVASNDHTASVWDLRSGVRLGNAFGPYIGTVPEVLFEPSGRLLLNLLSDGIEWPMDVGTWERFACRAAGRDLSPTEWTAVLPTRPYQRVCPG